MMTPAGATVRALLTGGGVGTSAIIAIARGTGVMVVAFLWARRLYSVRPLPVR
jgi:hypothetical protein